MIYLVIGVLLLTLGLPIYVIIFLGVISHFVWMAISWRDRETSREIFIFYLNAAEVLRYPSRHWYGFEIKDLMLRGESLLSSFSLPPALLYVTLGSLYEISGDETAAQRLYATVFSNGADYESSITSPDKDLKEYVRMLRKIESTPHESPQTIRAIRFLERVRNGAAKRSYERMVQGISANETSNDPAALSSGNVIELFTEESEGSMARSLQERMTLTEVLNDIYNDRQV